MASTEDVAQQLRAHLRKARALTGAQAALVWDQHTHMPAAAGAFRGEQMAELGAVVHGLATDSRVGEWLSQLEAAELPEHEAAGVAWMRRDYDKAAKLPVAFVSRMARLQSDGFDAWMGAREANDFATFAPVVAELLEMSKEQAELLEPGTPHLDVHIDDHDAGQSVAKLIPMFSRLRDGLVELLSAAADRPVVPALSDHVPRLQQLALHKEIVASLGYDLEAGGLDEAQHPFTINLGIGDVRITTNIVEDNFLSGLGGTVHEAGHAMYEQGIPAEWFDLGIGHPVSMGMHESQSRFWENFIGRSKPFFRWMQGPLERHLGTHDLGPDRLYAAANRIQPGLIRVYADEVTYNLHIILRFELEAALFSGDLAVSDLESAWNEKMKTLLGVDVPDPVHGVLQDVHWSSGSFGYFPSYTIGNLYAASYGAHLSAEMPDLWGDVEQGNFAPVLAWLRENIHTLGRLRTADQLVLDAVGQRDHVADLLDHLWGRHGALVGVSR